jgi:carbamoyl-phosphate synthase large subunit
MTVFFNILITSISRKVPLIKTVRQAAINLRFPCKLYGGDIDPECIARYFVDAFWQMPPQNQLNIEELVRFCKEHEIKGIIPTRDGELPYFARHCEFLSKHGISCLISKPEAIETCQNKFRFYQFLSSHGIPAIPTAKDIKLVSGPAYVVKECFGSGSNAVGLNLNLTQAESWARKLHDPIFQPFIKGEEYSVDVYMSRNRSLKAAIARKRELIVNGESQITYTIRNKDMEELCLQAADLLGIEGHAVFQLFLDASQHLHVIECNPRFGGASTLSVAMGLCSFEWFIQECLGKPLTPFTRSLNEMKLVRYPEDQVFVL